MTTWRPLLDGLDLVDARAAVDEIMAAQLPLAGGLELSTGDIGHAVLAAVLGDRAGSRATALRVAEQLGSVDVHHSLFFGAAGVAWMVRFLARHGVLSADELDAGDVDGALLGSLETAGRDNDYALSTGLLGLALYGLSPGADGRLVELALERLAALASDDGQGLRWRTLPGFLKPAQRIKYPAGRFNLGVLDGCAGVVGVMARAASRGLGGTSARVLAERTASALLAVDTGVPGRRFPAFTADGHEPFHGPLAWCHGDLGVAAVLQVAARRLANSDLERRALAIARDAATLDPATSDIVASSLCHGAAGVAHVFNRLYQATGEPAFRAAARGWFARLLSMRVAGAGVAGFVSVGTADDPEARSSRSFLWGTAGVALALSAATSQVEPDWDELLLLS